MMFQQSGYEMQLADFDAMRKALAPSQAINDSRQEVADSQKESLGEKYLLAKVFTRKQPPCHSSSSI